MDASFSSLRRWAATAVAALAVMVQALPAAAHNAHVHQPMTDFAWQIMGLVALDNPPERLTFIDVVTSSHNHT
ncbi:MAG: hypothetical protein ABI847_12950, partial [Anaerolineales bacterium]